MLQIIGQIFYFIQRILCLQSFNDFYVVKRVYPTQNNTFRKTCDTKIKWVYANTKLDAHDGLIRRNIILT